MTCYFGRSLTLSLLLTRILTVQNDIDGGILRWHSDNLKKIPYTFTGKNNIPDHNSSVEDIEYCRNSNFENYENFARQIYEEYNDFDDKLLFQGNGLNATAIETPVDNITRSVENLLLDALPNVKRSRRIRNLILDIIIATFPQTLINDGDNIYLYLKT